MLPHRTIVSLKFSLVVFLQLVILFFAAPNGYAQQRSVPIEHPVYQFLQYQNVSGNLPQFDNIILPLDESNVKRLLETLSACSDALSPLMQKQLHNYCSEFLVNTDRMPIEKSIFGVNSQSFAEHLTTEYPSQLYHYADSLFSFSFDLLGSAGFISKHIDGEYGSAAPFSLGGKFQIQYRGWIGGAFRVYNGMVAGNRSTAILDHKVAQSFTFNTTGINNFDYTEGYIRAGNDFAAVYFGKENTLWGVSSENPIILGDRHPAFDYLLAQIRYKSLRYDFMHGWLVTKTIERFPEKDQTIKEKIPKQFASSRLGIQISQTFSFGISQTVIYSGRSFEASYLNPMQFWESAQRAINDIDNSFLTADVRWNIAKGIKWYGDIMLDDIDFGLLAEKGFSTKSNRAVYQTGIDVTAPNILPDVVFTIDFCLIRPFTFSHPGYLESLNYTNNGFPLGLTAEPNSMTLAIGLTYWLTDRVKTGVAFRYYYHGQNVLDSRGVLIRNTGGDIRISYNYFTPDILPQFDGDKEKIREIKFDAQYYFSPNVQFNGLVTYQFREVRSASQKELNARIYLLYNFL